MSNFVFSVILVFFSFIGLSQEAGYYSRHFGVKDGLSSPAVYTAIKSSDGYIWFGTDAGVSKFDGYSFKNFNAKDGLTDNSVFELYEDKNGRIWYLPFNGRIGYIEDDRVIAFPYEDDIKSVMRKGDWVHSIRVHGSNRIEFFTYWKSYGYWDAVTGMNYWGNTGESFSRIVHTRDSNGPYTYLLGGQNWFSGERTETILCDYTTERIDTVYTDINPRFTMHFENDTSFCFDLDYYIFLKTDSAVRKSNSRHMGLNLLKIDRDGKIWVSYFEKGVLIYNNMDDFMEDRPPALHIFDGINVSDILLDQSGEAWICTESHGVNYICSDNILTYSFDSRIDNRIMAISINENGEVVFGNESGQLWELFGDTCREILELPGKINAISHKNGTFAVACNTAGIFNSLKWRIGEIDFFDGRNVMISKGEVWATGYRGIKAYSGDDVVFDSFKDGQRYFLYSIYEDNQGKKWAGGLEGLFCIEDGDLVNKNELFEGDRVPKVRRMLQVESGLYLLTTSSGLYVSRGEGDDMRFGRVGFDRFDMKDILVGPRGELWIGSNQGVFRISKADDGDIQYYRISAKNGMPSDHINGMALQGDRMYVATNSGLAVFDINTISENKVPPTLHINTVYVNEKKISRNQEENYVFEHDHNDIQFDFVGISFRGLGSTNYLYRLDGIDEKWQFSTNKSVRYPSLGPGDYIFRLKAANEDQVWSAEKRIVFTINKPFWEENWFLLIAGLFCFGLLFTIYWNVRGNRLRKLVNTRQIEVQKRNLIEAELKALRAQMNPHFTFNTLNSIQNSINNFDRKNAAKYVSNYSLLLRKVLENSRYLYISISDEVEMLKLYLDLENLRFDNTIKYEIIVSDELDPDFYEIPSMILQPMVENAIVHGISGKREGEKKLIVKILKAGGEIVCIVADNGIGRAESERIHKMKHLKRESLGTQITRERLELLYNEKGDELSFQIEDLYDIDGNPAGTRVKIIVGIREIN